MTTKQRTIPRPPAHLTVRVGVLIYDASIEVDSVMAEAVDRIQARDISVGGLLQCFGERLSNGKRSMWVEDIASGALIRLDRPRGSGAMACLLDPDALSLAQQKATSDSYLEAVKSISGASCGIHRVSTPYPP